MADAKTGLTGYRIEWESIENGSGGFIRIPRRVAEVKDCYLQSNTEMDVWHDRAEVERKLTEIQAKYRQQYTDALKRLESE